ncbi:MAG: stage II sporulation protein R [Blautia sp.]|nr:stage II sporulation protein R [Blautia sp.]MCM1201452.1 stage II sporulation protein R [Bacteroides fragilis]
MTAQRMNDRKRPVRKEAVMRAAGFLAGGFAFVWWCVLYPELCFPQDTYEAVYESGADGAGAKETALQDGMDAEGSEGPGGKMRCPAEENFRGLLQTEKEQVIVKSRLLEWLEQYI